MTNLDKMKENIIEQIRNMPQEKIYWLIRREEFAEFEEEEIIFDTSELYTCSKCKKTLKNPNDSCPYRSPNMCRKKFKEYAEAETNS